eukprot:403337163
MKNVSYLQDDPNIFNLPHEPLLRSSVMISSFDGRLIYLFFVDSNLVFHAIDATLYSSDRIDKLYSVPLDRKYVNSTCQDLIYIVHTGNFDNLYLFCESVNYDQQSYEEKKVQVHVIIQSPMEGIPKIKYIMYDQRKYLLDMQVLQQQSKVIVFIFKDMILNCHYNESIYQPDKPPYSLLECADEVSQVVEHPNPLSLFQHPADKNFYHVATSYPPSILEVDISDKYNFINYKIYTAVNDKSTHIGTSTLTANLNCILHLMKDIETGQSFIRFYDRKANRFEVSKYDYFIEKSWPTTYLGFQNQFINYLWVRDEQKIYSLSFYEWRIILDGRDSSLVTIYDDDIFSCNLTLSNSRIREDVYFNVTFIDKYNHTVLGKNLLRANTSNDLDAFYSCGDEEFIFSTTNMFIGPDIKINFSEYDQNCTDGSCFFVPENQYSYIYSNIIIEGIECNNNQIFPANKDAANGDLAYPILVCIQVRQQQIASYIINEELQTLNLTQVIKFPFQEFISFNYDLDDRALIFLSNTHEKWLSGIEVHFLYVENTAVIWKKSQKNPISGMEYFFDKLLDIYYDDIINKGCILFDKTSENSQMLIVFEIDYQKVELLIIAIETDINRYSSHYTLRTIVSSNIIFTIKSDDLISMLYYSETGFGIRLRWLRDIKPNVDSKDSVLDVDIIDDNYLVIYYTSSKIEVYQIFNEIYTTFTMRLPKYKNYENFTFNYQKDFGKIVVRTNIDGFLAILLYGDGDRYRIAVMSETNLIISGLSLYNNLMINYGEGYYQLLENCSQAIDLQDWEIENRKENAIKLADFQLTSYSSFSKQTSAFNDINLKVYTENQGLIVDPQVKGKNYIEVYYEKHYFFMIDSAFDWHLLKFPDNSKSLDLEAENKPLDVVATGQTQIQFGCIIDGYLNINEFHREEDKIQYVAMYQCNDPLTKYVKLSKITIYIRQKYIEQKDYIDIQHLIGNLQYPYQIISIELGFIYAFDLTRDVFQTCILISSDIPGSFTNIISKVDDTGVYFYDLQSLTKIFEINIKDHDDFFAQMLYQYGPLKVFACVEELKYNLHIITNYGIYIFTFRQDLRNDTSYFSDSQYKFEIIKKHVLRIPIDLFNSKIAINQYGYAFLVQKTTENNVSKIYLALVSFYSKITQKILKVIFVGDNLNCHSLNENDKFSSHSEDQIAVSIICESEIFVYRIFIRPHVEVDFSSFGQHAFSFENQNLTNGPFSYNQFNVTIFAQNPFSQYDDIKSVKVVYHYMENIDQGRTEFYLISFGLIIVIAILIVFLNHGPLQRKRQGSIIKENMNANEIKSLKSSVGYVNGYQLNLKNKDSRLIVNSIRDSKTIRLSKDINEILLKEQDTVKNNQEQQRLRETALTFNNHKTINHLSENIFGVSKEQNDLNSNSDKNFSVKSKNKHDQKKLLQGYRNLSFQQKSIEIKNKRKILSQEQQEQEMDIIVNESDQIQ